MEPPSPEILAPLIARDYPLAEPVTCDWLSSGLNDVFLVTVPGEQYILKVYRAGWRTFAEVQEEMNVLRHLHQAGISVSLPLPRHDGTLVWTLPESDPERPVVLLAHARGQALTAPEPNHWRSFGQTLAEIHNATDGIRDIPVRYDLEHLIEEPLRELSQFLDEDSEERAFLFTMAGRLGHNIRSLPPQALDRGYCHGDYRTANLFWDAATDTVTPLDFELGGIGYRAYDLANTLVNLEDTAMTGLWRAPVIENAEACWTAFLEGYRSRRPLSNADREAIPWFAALRVLMLMGSLVQTAREHPDGDTWPQSEPGGLPGGDLFYRGYDFLRAWCGKHL